MFHFRCRKHLWSGNTVYGIIDRDHTIGRVRETGRFLIEVMPLMFIPRSRTARAYHTLMPVLVPYVVITLVSTLLVMLVAGRVTQAMKERSRPMSEFMQNSVFWGVG